MPSDNNVSTGHYTGGEIDPWGRSGGETDPGPGGGTPGKNLAGVCGLLPKTLTLFMPKIWHVPYTIIYDLTKKFETLFMT